MDIVVLKQAKKEIQSAPADVVEDVFALFDDLASGKKLGMPISKPLPSIAKGLNELRISGRAGQYRVFYVIRIKDIRNPCRGKENSDYQQEDKRFAEIKA
jgi:phage-related protein